MNNRDDDDYWLKLAETMGFLKDGFDIHVKNEVPKQITLSKFGGPIPCLPEEDIPRCSSCHAQCEVLAQIYVPSLPPKIRSLFHSDMHNSLIVLFLCTNLDDLCFVDISGKDLISRIYNKDEIEKLIYKEREIKQNYVDCAVFTNFSSRKQTFQINTDSGWVTQITDDMPYPYQGNFGHCYFGGFPYYGNVIDENPGDDYHLILSLNYGDEFSFMWGDAGCAQIWMKNDDSHQFILTWLC